MCAVGTLFLYTDPANDSTVVAVLAHGTGGVRLRTSRDQKATPRLVEQLAQAASRDWPGIGFRRLSRSAVLQRYFKLQLARHCTCCHCSADAISRRFTALTYGSDRFALSGPCLGIVLWYRDVPRYSDSAKLLKLLSVVSGSTAG